MNQADSVKRLLTILEAEERLYLEMRDLLQKERELILNLDSTGLEQAVREKSALADEGRLLEESRAEVVRELADALEIASEAPTLSDLTNEIGSDDGGLRQAHSRLSALIGAVKEKNKKDTIIPGVDDKMILANKLYRLIFVHGTNGALYSCCDKTPICLTISLDAAMASSLSTN